MLRRYFFLIFISLLVLSGCARHHATSSSIPPIAQFKVETRSMPAFSRVNVQGAVNVSLHTGYKHSSVILRGDSRDLLQTITEIKNGILFVRVNKGAPKYGSIGIDIRGQFLNSFTYTGVGTIVGNNLHSSLLDLSIDNPEQTTLGGSIVLRKLEAKGGGSVVVKGVYSRYLQLEMTQHTQVLLAGVINANKLDLKGDGSLTMFWVKSPMLTICARGKSSIQLAGVADKLDLELWGSARFKGRFLRVKNLFVKTHDRAIAEVTAIKHQHALATDASDIYFYKIPETKADFMAFQGSVLDMRDLSLPYVEEYDRYNKEVP
ncbi:MAG: DUF2807 domain-containing protein [Tatlockia sp.]|nr:DUF2807 domain-containing protein [Tatlockia sp.]